MTEKEAHAPKEKSARVVDIIREQLKRMDGKDLQVGEGKTVRIKFKKSVKRTMDDNDVVNFVVVAERLALSDLNLYDPELLQEILSKLKPENISPVSISRFHFEPDENILYLGRMYFEEVVGSYSKKNEKILTINDPKLLAGMKQSDKADHHSINKPVFSGNTVTSTETESGPLIRSIAIELYPDDFNAGRRSLQIYLNRLLRRDIGSS